MKKKKWTALLMTACMAVGAMAGGTMTAAAEEEVINLKFMSWSSGGEQTAVKSAIASFEAQNPNIKVEMEFVDNENYTAKLNTLMAAGDAPNVAQMNGYLSAEYGQKGELLDMTPYLTDIDMDDVLPEAVYEYDGKIYGLNFGVECLMVFYNKDLFEAAGIETPSADAKNPWTWEEYVEAAKKLTTDINGKHPGEEGFDYNNVTVWGFRMSTSAWNNFILLNSNGGAYLAAEGDKLLVDSEESMEVLQAIQDLFYVEQCSPKPSMTNAMPSGIQGIMDGQVAMCWGGQYEIASFADAGYTEFGVAALPMFNKPTNMIWGEPLAVYDSGDEEVNAAAVKLVLALGDPSVVSDLFETAAQMPIYKSYYEDPEKLALWTENEWHTDELMSFFDSLFEIETTSREAYYVKNYDAIMAIVNPRLDAIYDGEDVAVSLEGIQEEAASEMQGCYKLVDYYSDAK